MTKESDNDFVARKDMQGISAVLDDHAISQPTWRRNVKRFLEKYKWFGEGCTAIRDAMKAKNSKTGQECEECTDISGKQHALFKRH